MPAPRQDLGTGGEGKDFLTWRASGLFAARMHDTLCGLLTQPAPYPGPFCFLLTLPFTLDSIMQHRAVPGRRCRSQACRPDGDAWPLSTRLE